MFEKLLEYMKPIEFITHTRKLSSILEDLFELYEEEYFKDKNAKDAAIDSVIEMLQKYKNQDK